MLCRAEGDHAIAHEGDGVCFHEELVVLCVAHTFNLRLIAQECFFVEFVHDADVLHVTTSNQALHDFCFTATTGRDFGRRHAPAKFPGTDGDGLAFTRQQFLSFCDRECLEHRDFFFVLREKGSEFCIRCFAQLADSLGVFAFDARDFRVELADTMQYSVCFMQVLRKQLLPRCHD